ncbi:hypothetical protein IGA99_25285 [Pseudomonas aeruginosa]|uniref:hypothetical protein n=1 Tax=Pseudomonas aeruginosa TaxID=287 RepID=UPI0022384C50|nr:hypothetical protein [Pseudomonas aeruginosa]ELC0893063.1 hypothetical protein [Pseudomonas aeruginosa]MCW5334436.1 hypothetical protein [Pseudomonas aeruginosa]
MPVFEVVSGGDRRSLMKRFERKSKQQAISELVDFHLLNCDRIEKLEAERDAALAEVERLRESKGDPSGSFDRCMKMMYERDENAKRLDAALARVSELDKQCRDDVARALGLRPSQERGFAWSYLLASIKSCVKASEDTAQAQHSVPDVCDGKEQDAFEEWARKEGLDTSCHPMHWLFLDAKTNSARQGWKAALRYVRSQLAAAPGKEGV